MKHVFKCGHKGLGQFCHRCAQAVTMLDQAKTEKSAEKAKKLKDEAARLLGNGSAPTSAATPA